MIQTIFVVILVILGYVFYISDKEDKPFTQTLNEVVEVTQGKRGAGCYVPGMATLRALEAVEKHILGEPKLSELSIIKSGKVVSESGDEREDTKNSICAIIYEYHNQWYIYTYMTHPEMFGKGRVGGTYRTLLNTEYNTSNPDHKEIWHSIKK